MTYKSGPRITYIVGMQSLILIHPWMGVPWFDLAMGALLLVACLAGMHAVQTCCDRQFHVPNHDNHDDLTMNNVGRQAKFKHALQIQSVGSCWNQTQYRQPVEIYPQSPNILVTGKELDSKNDGELNDSCRFSSKPKIPLKQSDKPDTTHPWLRTLEAIENDLPWKVRLTSRMELHLTMGKSIGDPCMKFNPNMRTGEGTILKVFVTKYNVQFFNLCHISKDEVTSGVNDGRYSARQYYFLPLPWMFSMSMCQYPWSRSVNKCQHPPDDFQLTSWVTRVKVNSLSYRSVLDLHHPLMYNLPCLGLVELKTFSWSACPCWRALSREAWFGKMERDREAKPNRLLAGKLDLWSSEDVKESPISSEAHASVWSHVCMVLHPPFSPIYYMLPCPFLISFLVLCWSILVTNVPVVDLCLLFAHHGPWWTWH